MSNRHLLGTHYLLECNMQILRYTYCAFGDRVRWKIVPERI